MTLTNEQREQIQNIEGTAGFRVIKAMLEDKVKTLDSVRGINKDGLVAEQALARQLAVEALEEFLSDIRIIEKPLKQSNTYE